MGLVTRTKGSNTGSNFFDDSLILNPQCWNNSFQGVSGHNFDSMDIIIDLIAVYIYFRKLKNENGLSVSGFIF